MSYSIWSSSITQKPFWSAWLFLKTRIVFAKAPRGAGGGSRYLITVVSWPPAIKPLILASNPAGFSWDSQLFQLEFLYTQCRKTIVFGPVSRILPLQTKKKHRFFRFLVPPPKNGSRNLQKTGSGGFFPQNFCRASQTVAAVFRFHEKPTTFCVLRVNDFR